MKHPNRDNRKWNRKGEYLYVFMFSRVFVYVKDNKTKEFEPLPSQLYNVFETEIIVLETRALSNGHIHDTQMTVITIEQ